MKFSDWKIKYINVLQRGIPRGHPPKPKRVKGEADLDIKLSKKYKDSNAAKSSMKREGKNQKQAK